MRSILWSYLESWTDRDIAALLRTWRDQRPETGVFALVCEREREAVAALQRIAADLAMPLLGAIVPGLVAEAKFWREGVLLVACDAALPRRLLPMPHSANRTTDAAVEALVDFAATHADQSGGDTLLLLVDATLPDVTSLLDRLYLEIGDQVNYAGTCVGSETFRTVPCLFDNEVFVAEAVLVALLREHPGAALAHHYRGGETLWVATATTGSHVEAIDGKPAFEVYRQMMASEYGIDLDRENFYRYAVHFPFALNRAQGESLVRIPVKVEDDGSVYCSGEVPENALLEVVRAVVPGTLDTALAVGSEIGPETAGALVFYCAGRLMHLEEAAATAELVALAAAVAPAPVVGALCLGEIGSGRQQYPAFHNATITAVPWI